MRKGLWIGVTLGLLLTYPFSFSAEDVRTVSGPISAGDLARIEKAYEDTRQVYKLFYSQGQHGPAIALMRDIVKVFDTLRGASSSDTLEMRMRLVKLLVETGEEAEAKAVYLEYLNAAQDNPWHDHVRALETHMESARRLQRSDKLDEAAALMNEVISAQKANPWIGPGHPDTLRKLKELAVLLQNMGNPTEAEMILREVLAGWEAFPEAAFPKADSPVYLEALSARSDLASLLRTTGKLAEAEVLTREIIEAQMGHPRIGPGDFETIMTRINLAVLLQSTGRFAEAEALYRKIIVGLVADPNIGPKSEYTLNTRANLATVLLSTGRFAEAESLLREVVAALEAPPDLAPAYSKLEKAMPILRDQFGILERGPDHPDTLAARINLTSLLLHVGKSSEAAMILRKVLAALEAHPTIGANHPHRLKSKLLLAGVLLFNGQFAEAEIIYREVFDSQLAYPGIGPDHPETLLTRRLLALLFFATGRVAEAAREHAIALAGLITALGEDHPDVQQTRTNLGLALIEVGKPVAALESLRAALAAQQDRASEAAGAATQAARGLLAGEQAVTAFVLAGAAWEVARRGAPGEMAEALRDEAFEAMQYLAAGGAAEALARSTARAAADDPALAELVARWEDAEHTRDALDRQILDLAGRSDLSPEVRIAQRSALETRRLEAGETIHTTLKQIGDVDPAFFDMIAPDPVTRAELQGQDGVPPLLAPNEALVLLSPPVGDNPGFVWAVSRTDARWARIGMTAADLADAVNRLQALVRDGRTRPEALTASKLDTGNAGAPQATPPDDKLTVTERGAKEFWSDEEGFDRQAAHELYKTLLDEDAIQDVIQGKDLILVPQGMLLSLPFAVLVTEKPEGDNQDPKALRDTKWLGLQTALTTFPASANLRRHNRSGPDAHVGEDSRLPLLSVANPAYRTHTKVPAGTDEAERLDALRKRCSFENRGIPRPFEIAEAEAFFRGAVADPDMLSLLNDLPCTEIEAYEVTKAHWSVIDAAKANDALHLGPAATETKIYQLSDDGRLARFETLHFAVHGILGGKHRSGKRSEPGLALTRPADGPKVIDLIAGAPSPEAAARAGARIDDGLLTASEAARLKLDADWVILSACDTAAAGTEGGEGLTGLASAFLYAGARALLVSHWPVRDDIAARLTIDITHRIAEDPNLSRAEALRLSMRAIMQDENHDHTDKSLAHPNAWAPFMVVGAR